MTFSKEPIAQSVAGGAIDRDDEASQLDLLFPPLTSADGDVATARSTACLSDRENTPEAGEKCAGSSMDAPERKPVRRKRIETPVRVTPLKRAINAVTKAGLAVSAVEVRPDGSIVLSTTQSHQAAASAADVFEQWADRL